MSDIIRKEEQISLDQTIVEIDNQIRSIKSHNPIIVDGHTKARDNKKLEKYEKAKKDLYFGRLDIVENDVHEIYYVGKTGIDKDESEILIVDWRSPFGKVYNLFKGSGEAITYENENGQILKTRVQEKRRIEIKNQKVIDVHVMSSKNSDEDDTSEVNYLNKVLSEKNKKHQVKEIISTLQREQDTLIRMDMSKPIIVQGVAGSGKTSIALHRISYLLYEYKWLRPENIMVLAPNKMFLSYLRHAAPELEIEEIRQSTFTDWAKLLLKTEATITEPFQILSQVISNEVSLMKVEPVLKFKGSMMFKKLLDKYLEYLESTLLPTKALVVEERILTREQLINLMNTKIHLPLNKRLDEVNDYVKNWIKEMLDKDLKLIHEQFDSSCRYFVDPLPSGTLRSQVFDSLEKSKNYRLKKLQQEYTEAGKRYLQQLKKPETLTLYRNLFNPILLKEICPDLDDALLEGLITSFESTSTKYDQRSQINYDDLAPLLYLDLHINGKPDKVDYLVVDEAQDFSPFQYYLLKELCNSVTFLGDKTQGIFSFASIEDWDELFPDVYSANAIQQVEINTSYRSTYEIMQMANLIVQNSPLEMPKIIPVNRHGEQPKIEEIRDPGALLNKIKESISSFKKQGYSKIAIICKELKQTENLYNLLRREGETSIQLIINSDQELDTQVTVIPSYLVKGLEFEAVILPNVSSDRFAPVPLDAKLLYVCATRANHALHIYFHKEMSPLLEGMHPIRAQQEEVDLFGIL